MIFPHLKAWVEKRHFFPGHRIGERDSGRFTMITPVAGIGKIICRGWAIETLRDEMVDGE